jgi:hypothetical protein
MATQSPTAGKSDPSLPASCRNRPVIAARRSPVAVLTTYDPRSSAKILAGSRPTAAWEAWSAANAADHPS